MLAGVPKDFLSHASAALVFAEFLLACLLIARPGSIPVRAAACVALVLFTAFLVWLDRTDPSIGCGCFGAHAPADPHRENLFGVGRNLAMVGLLCLPRARWPAAPL